jgi:hypothetical protein
MRARLTVPLVVALLVAGCSDDDTPSDDGSATVTADDGTSSDAEESGQVTASGTGGDGATTEATDSPSDDPTAASSVTEPATEEAPAGELVEVSLDLPTGGLDVGPDDAFVATPAGALFWHPDLLTAEPAEPILIAPSDGRNLVERVAGAVDGAVVFGACCDPVTGRVLAATGDEETTRLTAGAAPALTPSGDRLAAVSSRAATVIDTATGDGVSLRFVVPDDNGVEIVPSDVIWAGDDRLVVLASVDGESSLVSLDPESLEFGEPRPLEVADEDDAYVELAGYGPDGEVAVAVGDGDGEVTLRAFDAETLEEVEALTRELPPGVRAVRVNQQGAVLWVDDGALWHTPAGRSVPFPKGGVAAAAWFASPG